MDRPTVGQKILAASATVTWAEAAIAAVVGTAVGLVLYIVWVSAVRPFVA